MIEVRRIHHRPVFLLPADATCLLDRDTVLQAHTVDDHVTGIAIFRPMWYCHRIDTDPDLPPTKRLETARALLHYHMGMADHVTLPPTVPLGLLLHVAPENARIGLRFLSGSAVTVDLGTTIRYDNFRR
jgi:hypothetical protein